MYGKIACSASLALAEGGERVPVVSTDPIVVLDTAPTGHTLLLLDAAQSYNREVQRSTGEVPPEVSALLPRLKAPDFARVLIVTLAESTPVQEAQGLQDDLLRADIEPYGWVLNSSLAASGARHPLLASRARLEGPYPRRVSELSGRWWTIPWHDGPKGRAGLTALTGAAN